jgi:hypothetical protein
MAGNSERRNGMAEQQLRNEEDGKRIEWLQQLYAEWKANQVPTEMFEVLEYLDDDFDDTDLTGSMVL